MWLRSRLRGWREQRDRNSMVKIKLMNRVWLFSRRPTRLTLTGTHLASARLDPYSPPYSAAMCGSTQACATARPPAPTASHSHQRLQGHVECQGLCKMLRPGIADVLILKAAVSAQTSMSRTNWALCSRLPAQCSRQLLKAQKGNYLSKPSYSSSVSVGSLRLRRSMASTTSSYGRLLQKSTFATKTTRIPE
jgi:hypothetical protein